MYPSSSSNPNSNGDLDDIQQQINKKTNESLESTRRMLGLTSECEQIGVETMVNLDEQGEKLAKIEVRRLKKRKTNEIFVFFSSSFSKVWITFTSK